ncbi:Shiga toxin A subunit [Leclercia adecarboxylata ATCC 23216 = NBRC 102595]|nr:Shiga toxin A subunit [Leclercia adecarboxylata ATCC 23216 = NBRC 102595]
MFKSLVFLYALFPAVSLAAIKDEQCADVGRYLQSVTLSSFVQDTMINRATILEQKTKVEILGVNPVSDVLANQLADKAWQKASAVKGGSALSKRQYYSIFHDDNVKSIAAKYTFINKEGKKSVVISLGYMNDNECSVDYGGYLTLAREF